MAAGKKRLYTVTVGTTKYLVRALSRSGAERAALLEAGAESHLTTQEELVSPEFRSLAVIDAKVAKPPAV